MSRTWFRCLLVVAAMVFASAAWAQSSKRYALVVGNDAYRNVEPLKNARNDARLFAQVMREAKFEVISQDDLGREQFWAVIDQLKNRVNKGDEVVFYFAGHGVQIGATQYLLPVDVQPPDNDRQIERNAISLVDVLDSFNEARVSVFVIDACRDNPFPKRGTRSVGGTRGLVRPEPTTGQIVILSAGRDQKALDSVPGGSARNGLFTYELVQVIKAGNPEVRNAFETVKEKVDDMARKANHQQRPAVTHDLRGSFYFFPGGAQQVASAEPSRMAAQSAAASRMPSAEEVEQQAWEDTQRLNVLGGYEAFVRSYPNSRYSSRAQISIAALTPRPSQPAQQLSGSSAAPSQRSGAAVAGTGDLRSSPIGRKILSTGTLKMGVREASTPLSFLTGDGQYGGFHVELCRRVIASMEASLGRKINVEYLPVTSQNRVPLVQNGTVDLECGSTTNNSTRQRDVAFLNTTYAIEVRMAVKANSGINSIRQLNGKVVATTSGTTSAALLRRHQAANGVEFNEIFSRDHSDGMQLVSSGRADAFVMDDTILAGAIAGTGRPSDFLIVGEVLSTEPVAIMLSKDDPVFKAFGDSVLAGLVRNGEMQRIYDTWFMQPIPPRGNRIGLAVSATTRSAWAAPNDRPFEAYANR